LNDGVTIIAMWNEKRRFFEEKIGDEKASEGGNHEIGGAKINPNNGGKGLEGERDVTADQVPSWELPFGDESSREEFCPNARCPGRDGFI